MSEHFAATNAEYHAAPGISNSMVSTYLDPDGGPEMYEGLYLSKRFAREESDTFDAGTVVHDELLSGGGLVLEIPRDALDAAGKRTGKAWRQFQLDNPNRVLIRPQDMGPIWAMVDSVRAHPRARALLALPGESEFSIRWTDEETGLDRRARLDRVNDLAIVDLKTSISVNPRSFENSVVKYGYMRQASFYKTAMMAYADIDLPFCFIAVQKSPPYACNVFELSAEFLEVGRRQIQSALREIADRMKTGNWKGNQDIQTLHGPSWLFRSEEYEG